MLGRPCRPPRLWAVYNHQRRSCLCAFSALDSSRDEELLATERASGCAVRLTKTMFHLMVHKRLCNYISKVGWARSRSSGQGRASGAA